MFLHRHIVKSVVILFMGASLFSCVKEIDRAPDTDTSLAENYSYLEQNNNEINNIIIEALEKDTITSLKTSDNSDELSICINYTKWTANDTDHITIDFGNTNCLCNDQKFRRGKILLHVLTNKTWAKAETQNFYVNDNKIEGTRILTRDLLDLNIDGSTEITFADTSGTITEKFKRTISFTQGFFTPNDKQDDVFLITGTTSGTSKKGNYTAKITTALKQLGTCANVVSGILEITPEKKLTRTIDYGAGECDNLVTLSVGNYSKIIALK